VTNTFLWKPVLSLIEVVILIDKLLWFQGLVKRKTRFTSKSSANEIVTKIEAAAAPMGFDVKTNNYKVRILLRIYPMLWSCVLVCCFWIDPLTISQLLQMKLTGEKSGRKGQLAVATEVSFHNDQWSPFVWLAEPNLS